MQILIFYQYFTTPKGSWGTRIYEFAKRWVELGHEVEIVSTIYSKSDLTANRFIEKQDHDGIKVTVINVRIDNKQSFIKRVWSFIVYAMMSSYYAIIRKPDITIASSGPITVGIPGLLSKWIRRTNLVFEVRDLWPEGAIELGVLRNKRLIRFSKWFERTLYKNSQLVVGLSPGICDYVKENFNHPNVISITNSANLSLFGKNTTLADANLKGQQYAIYAGNIGQVNNSMLLVYTAEVLAKRNRSDIKILLIGDGQQKDEIEKAINEKGLKNLILKGLMPKEQLVEYVQHSLASLVPLKNTPILNTSSPNKLFESLAAGVPVIQTTSGWMKDFLDEYKVGFTVSPDHPEELADLLIELADNQSDHVEMRNQARKVAEQHFDKDILSVRMIQAIEEVCQTSRCKSN